MSGLPLFVYGTLLRGQPRAALTGNRRRGAAWTTGTLYHLPAGYPALTREGNGQVHGEWVDAVSDSVLAVLDRYEGVHEGLYERVEIQVHTASGPFTAWSWIMADPTRLGGVVVPSGRWRPIHRR